MLNMYCLRSTPTASPLVVFTDWQPLSNRLAVKALKATERRMVNLPGNMLVILDGEQRMRQRSSDSLFGQLIRRLVPKAVDQSLQV
jgi:hypothetical protein